MKARKYLNLSIAKALIEEVEKKANDHKIPVVIAISNSWGYPIAVHFMDGALPASYDIAVNKAFTSSTVRISTEELRELSKDGGELFGINNTNHNKIIAFPGGFPLEVEGEIVGGIGVSGGSADYDNFLAAYGKDLYKGVVKCLIMKN